MHIFQVYYYPTLAREDALLAFVSERGGQVVGREELPPTTRTYTGYTGPDYQTGLCTTTVPARRRVTVALPEGGGRVRDGLRHAVGAARSGETRVDRDPGNPPIPKTQKGLVTPARKLPRVTITTLSSALRAELVSSFGVKIPARNNRKSQETGSFAGGRWVATQEGGAVVIRLYFRDLEDAREFLATHPGEKGTTNI